MKIISIIFILLAWTIVKGMIVSETSGTPIVTFPTLATPNLEFRNLTGGCGGFVDCIEYVGAVIQNIGTGIIYIVLLLINLIIYIFEILALIITIQFTGIPGAPDWVSVLMATPFVGAIALIGYRLVRSGESED